jgi:hypothetical protein
MLGVYRVVASTQASRDWAAGLSGDGDCRPSRPLQLSNKNRVAQRDAHHTLVFYCIGGADRPHIFEEPLERAAGRSVPSDCKPYHSIRTRAIVRNHLFVHSPNYLVDQPVIVLDRGAPQAKYLLFGQEGPPRACKFSLAASVMIIAPVLSAD